MKTLGNASLLLLLITAVSCKPRTEHTIVQGYVKTFGSETTHAGIEIELNERSASQTLLDKTISNEDGSFQLEGEFDLSKKLFLSAMKGPKLHQPLDTRSQSNFNVETGGIQKLDLEFLPYSWVNIHFKNINPCNQYDFLGNTGTDGVSGAGADVFYILQTTGNRIQTFSYGVTKCDTTVRHLDTIGFIQAFDTVDFEVFY